MRIISAEGIHAVSVLKRNRRARTTARAAQLTKRGLAGIQIHLNQALTSEGVKLLVPVYYEPVRVR